MAKSGKWPDRLNDLYHNFFISNDCSQHSGKISICTFFVGF